MDAGKGPTSGMWAVARSAAERAVYQVLHTLGPEATVEEPIYGLRSITRTVPADWCFGITAARLVASGGTDVMYQYVRDARGAGLSWTALADPLGVPAHTLDRAVAAFELVAGEPTDWFDPVTVWWRCGSCAAVVTDHGPYNGHPTDTETGHASDCARHQTEITAYEAARSGED